MLNTVGVFAIMLSIAFILSSWLNASPIIIGICLGALAVCIIFLVFYFEDETENRTYIIRVDGEKVDENSIVVKRPSQTCNVTGIVWEKCYNYSSRMIPMGNKATIISIDPHIVKISRFGNRLVTSNTAGKTCVMVKARNPKWYPVPAKQGPIVMSFFVEVKPDDMPSVK